MSHSFLVPFMDGELLVDCRVSTLLSSALEVDGLATCGCVLHASIRFSRRLGVLGSKPTSTMSQHWTPCALHAVRLSAKQKSRMRSSSPATPVERSEKIGSVCTAESAPSDWLTFGSWNPANGHIGA